MCIICIEVYLRLYKDVKAWRKELVTNVTLRCITNKFAQGAFWWPRPVMSQRPEVHLYITTWKCVLSYPLMIDGVSCKQTFILQLSTNKNWTAFESEQFCLFDLFSNCPSNHFKLHKLNLPKILHIYFVLQRLLSEDTGRLIIQPDLKFNLCSHICDLLSYLCTASVALLLSVSLCGNRSADFLLPVFTVSSCTELKSATHRPWCKMMLHHRLMQLHSPGLPGKKIPSMAERMEVPG